MVLLSIGNGYGERDQANAPPDGVVGATDVGSVVRGEEDLEGGDNLEGIGVESANLEMVAPCDLLNQSLCHPPARIGLHGGGEANAGERGKVVFGGHPVALAGEERPRIHRGRVAAENPRQRNGECALPVATPTPKDEYYVLGRPSCQRVPD